MTDPTPTAQTRYERKLKDRGVRTVSVRLEPGTLDLLTALAKAFGSRQAAITKAIELLHREQCE